jgi:putative spermidine/putrescine transport system ATP-binding protein
LHTAHTVPPGERLYAVARAEQVLLPDECDAQTNRFRVRLQDVIYQGDSLLLVGEAAGQAISIRRPLRDGAGGQSPRGGETIEVGLAPRNTIIVTD